MILNGFPWKWREIILSFLRLHPSTLDYLSPLLSLNLGIKNSSFLSLLGEKSYSFLKGQFKYIFVKFPPTPPIRVSHSLLLLAIIVCRNFMSSLSLSHVIKSLGRERCFLPHLSYYLYPNTVNILGPWSGLGYAQFSKIEIWLTYNIMFISGVLHSDLTFAYIVKLLWH